MVYRDALSVSGPPLFRDGVCERRRPHVPDTAFRKVQGARGRVSHLILTL